MLSNLTDVKYFCTDKVILYKPLGKNLTYLVTACSVFQIYSGTTVHEEEKRKCFWKVSDLKKSDRRQAASETDAFKKLGEKIHRSRLSVDHSYARFSDNG